MNIDFELYRREVRVAIQPARRLSVIDIWPEYAAETMVFIHGFGGRAAQWQYQLDYFSRANRVVAMDLHGHGLSDRPSDGYRMRDIQDDLEILLHALGINQPLVLLGHSFGGALAATFAARHPERVKSLVLLGSAVRYRLNPYYRAGLRLPETTLRFVNPFLRGWVHAPAPVLKNWYENNLAGWDGQEIYQQLKMPVLVIRGYHDRLFEKPAYDQVAQLIPDAEEIDVGASGHMVMLERKEAVNRAITRFLEAGQPDWINGGVATGETQQATLLKERPWLARYDKEVPYTIAVPRVALHSLLQSAARRFPRRAALIFKGQAISYRRLQQEVNRFSNGLRRLNLRKGERVILALPNTPQMVTSFFGALQAGGCVVFARPGASPNELVEVIRDSGARILVTLTEYDELIQQIRTEYGPGSSGELQHVIFSHIGDYLSRSQRLRLRFSPVQHKRHLLDIPIDATIHVYREWLRQQSSEAPEVEVGPGDLAVITYTGGTSARPKGVMLSHRNLFSNVLQTRHWMPEASEGAERVVSVVPLAHCYGLTAGLNTPIALGATILLEAEPSSEELLETIQHYQPTIFPGVPQIFIQLMNVPGVRKYGLSAIRTTISGSAPLPLEVLEAYEKLTQSHLTEGYGLSEASPITHINPLGGLQKPGTIGLPVPSTEARLVDLRSSKRSVAAGQIGELAVRGPQVMLGYWRDPKTTSRVLLSDGWLLTGDVAQMDSDGYFRIIARKDEMWYPNRPDWPASPRAVEEVLYEIPQVKEAAVTALAGQPVAFVIPGPDRPTTEAVLAYCRRRLPPELAPKMVIFVDEFPRSFIGKVLRQELARRLEQKYDSSLGKMADEEETTDGA